MAGDSPEQVKDHASIKIVSKVFKYSFKLSRVFTTMSLSSWAVRSLWSRESEPRRRAPFISAHVLKSLASDRVTIATFAAGF